MSSYNVIISDEARRQLSHCVLFLAQQSEDAARNLQQRFIAALRNLERLPARFPFFNEPYIPNNKYHKMFVEKWYLILYQIKDTTVYVDYVLDCRQDYRWLIH